MNTYEQDETIPIFIFLSYGKNTLKFPINPENLKSNIDSSATTEDIEGIGQVSVPGSPKLAEISIHSFFWHKVNLAPAFLYVNWLKKWQRSRNPAKLIVTRLNYSMQVTCERFTYDLRAGEEKDIYFELELREFRPYGAKHLNPVTNETVLSRVKSELTGIASTTMPVLIEIPRPTRGSSQKEAMGNIFKAVTGYTTICSIARKITGSSENWGEIYEENKELFGNIASNGRDIPIGTEIKVPRKYVTATGSGGASLQGAV